MTTPRVANVGIVGGEAARPDVDHVDARAARLASRQDGVVSRRQLLALGLTARQIDHRLRTRRLAALHRGVYAVGHTALTHFARARAALLAAGPTAVLSHRTAAWLWRLIAAPPPVIEVTTTGRARRDRETLRIHETRRPPARRTVRSLAVTSPLRTLVDLRRAPDIERLCSEALLLGLVTEPQLVAAGLMTPLTAPARSELEHRFRALCHDADLPRALVNHPLGRYVPDFTWPAHRVVVEVDGFGAHGRRAAFEDDRARDADLAAQGWLVLRFTWRQLRDEPLRVVSRLSAVLRSRSPRPRGPAAG